LLKAITQQKTIPENTIVAPKSFPDINQLGNSVG